MQITTADPNEELNYVIVMLTRGEASEVIDKLQSLLAEPPQHGQHEHIGDFDQDPMKELIVGLINE